MTSALDLLLLLLILSSSCLNSQAKITYVDHCGSIVPQSSFSTISSVNNISFRFTNAYFTGAENFFSSPSSSSSSKNQTTGNVRFYTSEIYNTNDPKTYHLSGKLSVQKKLTRYSSWRVLDPKYLRSQVNYISGSSVRASFDLSGFWSKSTGKLCMVGTGSSLSSNGKYLKLSVMYTMDISDPIARGMLKSVDSTESSNHFDTISVVGYHRSKDYAYTKIPAVKAMCASLNKVPTESLGFGNQGISNYITHLRTTFLLGCGKDCITPYFTSNKTKFMSLDSIVISEDGNVTMLIGFSNSSYYGYDSRIVPGKSLVGEGYWDSNKKSLCVLASPLLEDLSIGESTIGLRFRFPSVFTVKDRANVLGSIWSTKGIKEPGYFSAVSLRSLGDSKRGFIPGVKYEYTKLGSVEKNCSQMNPSYARFGRYPNGNSIADLNFDLTVKTKNNQTMPGYAVPFSLDGDFFGYSFLRITNDVSFSETKNYSDRSSYKVSYLIKYGSSTEKESMVDISAEGIYNSEIGKFCMVGCKSPSYNSDDDSQDCDIQIDIQLSPYDIYANHTGIRHLINGTIVSTRKNEDPRYFEPLILSSYTMYESEFHSVMERMDMEIILVMISLTLSCIFIMMQIFYVRKHKNAMPSISVIMLVILVTGHVMPLLTNLESIFENRRSSRSVMLWSGGWVEVNEVVVRVLTLVASLLQLRLLQLTWDNSKFREMKVMKFLLPFYFGGALISWFVHKRTFSAQHVISYCDLILDGFLLPQIIFNFIVDSKEKALAPVFYMGTTAVFVLPHIYNAYRARYNVPYLEFSYIYASKDGGFFLGIWDFIIPLGSILFAVLVFLQQKYGGTCLIPSRFRKNVGYERVPVINL